MASAPNPIRRLVQLILDKKAAAATEAGAKKTLSAVETSASRLEGLFKRLGGVLAAAFGVRALINFGKEAIKQAAESQRIWADLQGTIEATGNSFTALEGDLRSLSTAFQDATVHTDEDYASSLSRLIAITGDTQASINNMGLTANVAARFFNGELAPATDLVAKVMNGATGQLARLGIQVTSAQEGLQVLAERSFGAAEARAATFEGRLQQINNLWGEFQEQLGAALVTNEEAIGALDVVRGVIVQMTQAVEDNRDAIGRGLVANLKALITVLDATYRAIRGIGEILVGIFFVNIGIAARGVALLGQAFNLALDAGAAFFRLLGAKGISEAIARRADELRDNVKAIREWSAAARETGGESVLQGLRRFAEPTFDLDNLPKAGRRRLKVPPPMTSRFGKTEGAGKDGKTQVDDITKALKTYETTMRSVAAMSGVLGEKYDVLGARAEALTTLVKGLAEGGMAASDPIMVRYTKQLQEVTKAAGEHKALEDLARKLQAIRTLAPLMGRDFDRLGAEATALEGALVALEEAGVSPTSAKMVELAERLAAVRRELALKNAVKDFDEAMRQAAGSASLLGKEFDDQGRRLDQQTVLIRGLQEEGSALLRTLETLRQAGFTDADPAMAAYIDRLGQVQKGLRSVAKEAQIAADASQLAGEIMGAVLTSGLGPFAAAKARQNLIEAAEEVVRGISAALNPFTAPLAGAHFALAAKHTAIAGAWAALAKGFGGGGGIGGGSAGGSGAGRGTSGQASTAAQEPAAEVHIHLVGPGWNALNPEVQRVVHGAELMGRERFGDNAKVTIHRGGA